MLRFIVLSLAMHGLAVGIWYHQETGPGEISGGTTLALVLLAPATTATGSRVKPQAEHPAPDTAPAARLASPPEPHRSVPVPAGPPPHLHAPTGRTAATAPAATVETPETADREPASAAPAATTPAADDRLARQAVQTAVTTALKANFRYPRIARRNGWEGTVMLALRVLPDGQLTDILVSSSSGHAVLDRAALHTVQTASVPQAKQWLGDRAVDLVLPVEYRLLDS